MVVHYDSALNMGWDASYYTAYLFERVLAKVQYKLRVASGLNISWYGSMEWNVEEHFSMEWKIFSMEWKLEKEFSG